MNAIRKSVAMLLGLAIMVGLAVGATSDQAGAQTRRDPASSFQVHYKQREGDRAWTSKGEYPNEVERNRAINELADQNVKPYQIRWVRIGTGGAGSRGETYTHAGLRRYDPPLPAAPKR